MKSQRILAQKATPKGFEVPFSRIIDVLIAGQAYHKKRLGLEAPDCNKFFWPQDKDHANHAPDAIRWAIWREFIKERTGKSLDALLYDGWPENGRKIKLCTDALNARITQDDIARIKVVLAEREILRMERLLKNLKPPRALAHGVAFFKDDGQCPGPQDGSNGAPRGIRWALILPWYKKQEGRTLQSAIKEEIAKEKARKLSTPFASAARKNDIAAAHRRENGHHIPHKDRSSAPISVDWQPKPAAA